MNIKTIKSFTIGSNAFFSELDDFENTHDVDTLHIIDYPLFGETIQAIHKDDRDDFFMYKFGKDKLIALTKDPLQVGKFLVPEFARYIDMTIDDLKRLEPLLKKIDEKHTYEKMIYDYYIENDDFVMTDAQLKRVYEKYKQHRKNEGNQ